MSKFPIVENSFEPLKQALYGAAMSPGGVYVSLAEGLTDERTKPTELINSMLPMSLRWSGSMFEQGEIAQSMLRAGSRTVQSRVEDGPQLHGPAYMDIGRKSSPLTIEP